MLQLTIDQLRFYFYSRLPVESQRDIKKLFRDVRTYGEITNEQTTEDVELLTNFIRLLRAC